LLAIPSSSRLKLSHAKREKVSPKVEVNDLGKKG
jgi:hypothetical protein